MSFIPVAEDSDFPIQNLPYGVFSTQSNVSIDFWAREPGGGSSGRFLSSLGGGRLWLQCSSGPIAVQDTEIQARYMWAYASKNQLYREMGAMTPAWAAGLCDCDPKTDT